MFGILDSVKKVADVVSTFESLNLIIKTHPGENKNIPLYEDITNKYGNISVKCDANLCIYCQFRILLFYMIQVLL